MKLRETRGRKAKYTYKDMKLNKAFKVDNKDSSSALSTAKRWLKKHGFNYTITARTIDGVVYLFRIK